MPRTKKIFLRSILLFYVIVIMVSCSTSNECTPNCAYRECGDDGCGGVCQPGCGTNETCSHDTGKCESNLTFCSEVGELTLLGTYDLPDYAYDIEVVGEHAYIADTGGGLQIVNVSDPSNPKFAGEFNRYDWGVLGVSVSGDVAFLAYSDYGLYSVDITDPTSPTEIGNMTSGGRRFYDVSVVGTTAYVAWDYHDGDGGMEIFDVSDPSKPYSRGRCSTEQHAGGITVDGSFAYVANGFSGVYTIELLKPESPLGNYDTPGYANQIAVDGNYGYIADGQSGLLVIDISDKSNPSFVSSLDLQASVGNVFIAGQYAYLVGMERFQIVDIRDPANPSFVRSYNQLTGGIDGLDVRGNLAYLGGQSLHIVKVCDLP